MPTTATTMTNALLDAALDYAGRGWRVLALKPGEKRPIARDWVREATADPDQVRRDWRHTPRANVGVALGSGSGLVGIDVDTEEGERLLALTAGGALPPTCWMTTGKGTRFLFAIPEQLDFEPKTTVVKGADGGEALRYQGHGGQCVMPPSVHPSGKLYAWVEGCSPADLEPAPMPPWLIEAMTPPTPEPIHPAEPEWSDQGARDAHLEGRDFNKTADWWADILSPAGFTAAKPPTGARGSRRYCRPGKGDASIAVTVGYWQANDGTDALYVFSGSIAGLVPGKCYDKFGAYARLFHRGDFAAAAAELARRGFTRAGYRPGRPSANGGAHAPGSNATAPPPATSAPADWPDPTPLDDPAKEAPPFPLHVLPQALVDLVAASAEACGAPPDFAAAEALGVAAGAIGTSTDLMVKRGYYAPSSLWVCVVAAPGGGKSPSVAPILAPVFREQGRRRREGDDRDALVSDVTVAKLAEQMHADPRGQLMIWDEMAAWLTSYDQYKGGGRGNDRAQYLSMWDGRAIKVDRKGPDSIPVFVPRPRLSVVGGIQPEVLDQLRAGPADGLFDRFLFAFPADSGFAVEEFAEADDDLPARAWGAALAWLWNLDMRSLHDGEKVPHARPLAAAARPAWTAWSRELAGMVAAPDAPPYLRSVCAKIAGYTARLTLVTHLLHQAYRDPDAGDAVGLIAAERGIDLARYFLAHALRVRRAAGRDPRLAGARAVLRWALGRDETKGPAWARAEVWNSTRRGSLFGCPEDIDGPLDLLESHRIIRCTPDTEPRSGRRVAGKGMYELNPKASLGLM